ncbi:hypothetical protein GCM10010308_63900 [Streptomyces vinaceusdrappus]|nr:hypothetical protein GCM10010301_64040 [Streptomyces plicatus]GHC36589.1 hypothetical protein GCM10010308_63900 [Streptomyces vinaceusdrappus]
MRIGSYPRVRVEGGGRGVASQAGSVLPVETLRKTGLDAAISAALAPWRMPRAVHNPAGRGARGGRGGPTPVQLSSLAADPPTGRRLWQLSEQLTDVRFLSSVTF